MERVSSNRLEACSKVKRKRPPKPPPPRTLLLRLDIVRNASFVLLNNSNGVFEINAKHQFVNNIDSLRSFCPCRRDLQIPLSDAAGTRIRVGCTWRDTTLVTPINRVARQLGYQVST